jgi:uncharacterized membrane protein
VVVHYAVIVLYPYGMMAYLQKRIIDRDGKNTIHHSPRPTSESRIVVAPSPDLIYSVASFDVSETPLHINAPLTGSYMSLSLYAKNSDNFYVQNDTQVDAGQFDVVLIGPKTPEPVVKGARLVRSPSPTGIVLFRYFVGRDSEVEKIESLRRQIACTLLK